MNILHTLQDKKKKTNNIKTKYIADLRIFLLYICETYRDCLVVVSEFNIVREQVICEVIL